MRNYKTLFDESCRKFVKKVRFVNTDNKHSFAQRMWYWHSNFTDYNVKLEVRFSIQTNNEISNFAEDWRSFG